MALNKETLSPMLFTFALQYAFTRVQVNQDGLKLNGRHRLLAYADDVNILGGRIHTVKENTEAVVAATRETGREVSADKTKYMVMSRDQNAGRIDSVRIDNSTFERVEEFKYLGTTLINQNLLRKKLRADWDQEVLAIIRCRIFCLPGCYPKIYRSRYIELLFCLFFCMGVKLGR
jgi:hypothetical protein